MAGFAWYLLPESNCADKRPGSHKSIKKPDSMIKLTCRSIKIVYLDLLNDMEEKTENFKTTHLVSS